MSQAGEHSMAWEEAQADEFAAAIRGALAPLRPDADEFAQGVRERIERENEKPAESTGWLRFGRKVAVFVPVWLLPKSLTKMIALVAAPAAKKSAWYYFPGVLALPLITLLAALASFVFALKRSSVTRDGEPDVELTVGYDLLIRKYIFHFFLVIFGLGYVAIYSPVDAFVLALVVSTLWLVGVARVHASSAQRSRQDVGVQMATFLGVLSLLVAVSGQLMTRGAGEFGHRWAVLLLFVGGALCAVIAEPSQRQRVGLLPILINLFTFAFIGHVFDVPTDRQDVVSFVETEADEWLSTSYRRDEFMNVLRHIGRDGGSEPDLTPLKQALPPELRSFDDVDGVPVLVRNLAALGYLEGRDYADLDIRMVTALLEDETTFSWSDSTREAARRLREQDISEEDRGQLAQAMCAEGLLEENNRSLRGYVGALRVLERLGATTPNEELEASVRAEITSVWTGYRGARLAGFAHEREDLERDANGKPIESGRRLRSLGPSHDAVQLMLRFGVPTGVDLVSLHRYLHAETIHGPFSGADLSNALAFVALSSLKQLPEWQPIAAERATLTSILVRYRAVVAALLLVAFSIIVTLRAPKVVAQSEPAT